MKILLFGEYSNVHHTLCEALRRAGHEVLLISDGDGWKDYPRDIDLRRRIAGPLGSLLYLSKLLFLLPKLRGFDVVQLINPIFLDVKPRWNRWMTTYLKRHNRVLCLGCYGDDYYVVSRMQQPDFMEYTDFHCRGKVIDHALNQERIVRWCSEDRIKATMHAATECSVLMAGLYEYYKVYDVAAYREKLHYMPFPIEVSTENLYQVSDISFQKEKLPLKKVRILLATQKQRTQMKGTDLIEPLLLRLAEEHQEEIELHSIVSVPFAQYQQEVAEADVIVDQLYSYTPAMGALEAMRQGKVVISGYEPEFAQFLAAQEPQLQKEVEGEEPSIVPGIINLRPFEDEENYRILEETLLDRQKIAQLSAGSQAYVAQYHDADKVAQRCVGIWQKYLV